MRFQHNLDGQGFESDTVSSKKITLCNISETFQNESRYVLIQLLLNLTVLGCSWFYESVNHSLAP
jgi:hypothetical protein